MRVVYGAEVPVETSHRPSLVSGASASVTAITSRKAASLALEENHFSPSITHSLPSCQALQTNSPGSAPPCGSVIEKHETMSPSSSGARYFFF